MSNANSTDNAAMNTTTTTTMTATELMSPATQCDETMTDTIEGSTPPRHRHSGPGSSEEPLDDEPAEEEEEERLGEGEVSRHRPRDRGEEWVNSRGRTRAPGQENDDLYRMLHQWRCS